MQIEDGHGTGTKVKVVQGKRLYVHAVTTSIEHEINHDEGLAFHVVFNQSPTAADDCIFYMKNTSDIDLVVEGMRVAGKNFTADTDSIYFEIGNLGTPAGTTELTPVNVNAGSGKSATGEFYKGADLQTGASDLASGSEVERLLFPGTITDITGFNYNFPQDVIIPKNQTFTIWIGGSNAGTWYFTIYFNYHEES